MQPASNLHAASFFQSRPADPSPRPGLFFAGFSIGRGIMATAKQRRFNMHENLPPDDAKLGALLREARAAPSLPPRFAENVWRRIENTDAPATREPWLDALAAWILRPRFALAAAGVLLLAGVSAGTLQGRQLARHDAQMNYLAAVAPHAAR
jgi:hypothetical protein